MTEDEARTWAAGRFGADIIDRLLHFEAMVLVENDQQNLIAPSTVETIWARHIVDSLQLVPLARGGRHWIDVGTGAGFPGMVVAAASDYRVTLIEPRRLRTAFLARATEQLGIADRVHIVTAKSQNARVEPGDMISARAVASLSALLEATRHLVGPSTRYICPKGRSASEEVGNARREWHGTFHVERSVVDPDAGIVIADGVRRR